MPAAEPTIYIIAGCNGAGKTTFAKEFLPRIGVIRFLNADEIARGLWPLGPEAVSIQGEHTACPPVCGRLGCWFRLLAETDFRLTENYADENVVGIVLRQLTRFDCPKYLACQITT